jgi:homoserine O-acetyltransferase
MCEALAHTWPVVRKQSAVLFQDNPLVLESGARLNSISVAYETLGQISRRRDNVVLICHALTGDSHVSGVYHPADKRPGWWDDVVGPGKAVDTNRYFVLCSNVLGGCQGTTGPSSINPETGVPYGRHFPIVTVRDIVRVQRELLNHLGITQAQAVIGGSLGGMQAIEWAVSYPELVAGVVPIAASGRFHPQGIALNEVQRQAITKDPEYKGGWYYPGPGPQAGLATARMLGMITYRSDESMWKQFGRETKGSADSPFRGFEASFEVESYLHHQGEALVKRFDANSYLYLTRAMDLHDIGRGRGGYREAYEMVKARSLVVGIRSDLLFPTYQQVEMASLLARAGNKVNYFEMDSPWGHDAFLMDYHLLEEPIREFLAQLAG